MIQDCMIWGNSAAPILIVGMAPGRDELKANMPFVGGSGKVLWALARGAGFSRDDCFIVNTIGEWPEKSTGGPSKVQLERYWDRFDEAMRESKARIAICLGGDAFARLTGIVGTGHGIEAWRGYIVEPYECGTLTHVVEQKTVYKGNGKNHKKGDPRTVRHRLTTQAVLPPHIQYIFPTLHPAAVLRAGMKTLPVLAADIRRAGRGHTHQIGHITEPTWAEHIILPNPDSPVCVDIETTQTPAGYAITRGGMASAEGCWSMPWDAARHGYVDALMSDAPKIAHNFAFDIPRIRAEGIKVKGPFFCTMLAAAMVQPDLYKGLESVTSLYLDRKRWKHLSDSHPAKYNALDCANTLALYPVLVKELKRVALYDIFTQDIMPGAEVFMDMTKKGIPLHQQRLREWIRKLSDEQTKQAERWIALTGASPSSNAQVMHALYDTLGLPQKWHKRGTVTADAAALEETLQWIEEDPERVEQYRKAHEAVTALLAFREVNTQLKTFTDPEIEQDGRVHPSYLPAHKDDDNKQFGKGLAGTWRPTTRNPNMQNQTPEARKLYMPSYGKVFAEFDFKQIELRVTAAASGDAALMRALATRDPFAEIMVTLGIDRVRAKNLMYGTIYGAGPKKLAATFSAHGYRISERECKKLQDGIRDLYPQLWQWRISVVEKGKTLHYVENPFGLRRYFYQDKDAPAMINFTPQSTTAMIIWKSLVPLAAELSKYDGRIVNTVHDNFLVEFALSWDKLIPLRAVKKVLEREWPEIAPGFRVPVECKVGYDDTTSWGELAEIKLDDPGSVSSPSV